MANHEAWSRERAQLRAGEAGDIAKAALGIDWYDTESQARRVAEYAQIQIGLAEERVQNIMNANANLRFEMKKLEDERDGLLSARDDLGKANARLVAELGDAKQSIIDLQGANAAYVRANGRLRAEADAEKLLRQGFSTLANAAADYFEALEIAHRHIDMAALQVSHPKDAEMIRTALAERPSDQPAGAQS